ncbi:hypothetical protein [Phenylobacterium sp.]|jgi:hypothetical protein|uniref:hypothetical protein n=1 Tax=Phenylobacterium sp. TaxID=1871053 RepID=UPI0035B40D77
MSDAFTSTLRRQIARATGPDGTLDVERLLQAVNESYLEHARDVRRMTRANALMVEELQEMMQLLQTAAEDRNPLAAAPPPLARAG